MKAWYSFVKPNVAEGNNINAVLPAAKVISGFVDRIPTDQVPAAFPNCLTI